MSAGLNLAPRLSLDPDYVGGGTFALLAKKGWGKTYAMRVLAEEFAKAGVPFVCLDPMDAFWGLRAGKSGAPRGGVEIPIFGGPHGDAPLEPTAGKLMADLVVDEGLSAVLSIAHFGSRSAERRFAMDFLDRLYRRNSRLVHLLIDEADLFAPQKPQAGDQPLLGVTENIVRRGRNKGIGITLGTQRPAVLNKDVLTQVDGLIVGRMLGPQDRNAIDAWVGEHGDTHEGKKVKDELPDLQTGVCTIWIPELGVLQRTKIREARTFDSSPTRKRTTARNRSLTLADIDLSSIADKISATVERAKAEDPRELRKQIRELQRQLVERPEPAESEPVEVKVPFLPDEARADLRSLVQRLEVALEQGADVASMIERHVSRAETIADNGRPAAPRSAPTPAPAAALPSVLRRPRPQPGDNGEVKLKAGARRMITALASMHPSPLSRSQLALLADISKGGTFSTYLGSLERAGLVEEDGTGIFLTGAGIEEAGDGLGSGPPAPSELQAMWSRKLKAGARRMLDELMQVHPNCLTRDELAERAGVSKGGTFSTYLGSLRRNGLMEERGEGLFAGEALFLGERTAA